MPLPTRGRLEKASVTGVGAPFTYAVKVGKRNRLELLA